MKVLVVDDDAALREMVCHLLRRAGFLVVTAADGQRAIRAWSCERPDIVLLDIQIPVRDGLAVCRELRAVSDVPIILLSVHGGDEDIVHGLDIGADDYVAKPFSPRQLLARVRAVLRRALRSDQPPPTAYGDCVLDPSTYSVATERGRLSLTPLEYRLLACLLARRGRIVPTHTVLRSVWGGSDGDSGLLKQLVYRLRRKLASHDLASHAIETIPRTGYMISGEALEL